MVGSIDPYELLASYYDAMHSALVEDIGFVLSLAAQGGPVLELGCGTGRLLLPLARSGHQIVGVDRSMPMLSSAQTRLQKEPTSVSGRVRLLCADMTTVALAPAHYGLAIIPYNTFMHLNYAQAVSACRRVRAHLLPGGQLFIDIVNPLLAEQTDETQGLTLERVLTDESSGDVVLVMAANELDSPRQLLKITWLFDRTPQRGGPIQRTVVQVAYHYYFPHQLELLLEEAGLELVAMYGSYGKQPYDSDCERLLAIARRAP